MRLVCKSAWMLALAAWLPAPAALALDFNNQTLTGTVTLPAGQTHRFFNTITLSGARSTSTATMRNEQSPVRVTGMGVVNIHGPEGIWTDGWVYSHLTIDPNVGEVRGHFGIRFYPQGVNWGVLAAVPGGDSGFYDDEFLVGLDSFVNEGVIEVRHGRPARYVPDGWNVSEQWRHPRTERSHAGAGRRSRPSPDPFGPRSH